eukprot:TRINITY_DN5573_c0_g1_i1.p1 TRINITY_DN5573_c0_g1~~TRINITY_DN5573_c0_g1_i1.p1  ORF type:complete len:188 (-),score=56.92 TRINITY_DN5573_c0_g1_i1:90-653(-)
MTDRKEEKEKKVMSSGLNVLALDAEPATNTEGEVTFVSKEGYSYKISKKAAAQSTFVKTALDDKDAKEIPLKHIEGKIVEKIVEYMNYHAKNLPRKLEKPLRTTNLRELVDDFDTKFLETTQEVMFKLLLAANYMDIKSLLFLMCAKVASMLKGKTPDQIRKTFNIRSDYTPEEEEQVKREFRDLLE